MRSWHGLCPQASWLGADGGVARYRLRLEPTLALLRLRRDNYIFQDKSVRDIAQQQAFAGAQYGPGIGAQLKAVAAMRAARGGIGGLMHDVAARWAAPGDIIVYQRTDNPTQDGHIDIRTYDGYISDFCETYLPVSKFTVTGIYRKYYDPEPALRMCAFLMVIASREAIVNN